MKRALFVRPMFIAGLLIRLILVWAVLPAPVERWFVPFLTVSTRSFNLDPWAVWLAQGGMPLAFPYGYCMWLALLPMTLLCKLVGAPLMYGYGATLIAADFGLLSVLRKMIPNRDQLLLSVYWLSPIIIVASYLQGFNDLIPVALLTTALWLVRRIRLLVAGVFCIAAISAKLSMVLALPFLFIYLVHNRALRPYLQSFLKGLAIGAIVLLLPFLFSRAGLQMLMSNPELGKVYRLALQLDGQTMIYLVPLAYLFIVYAAWRVRRLNFDLFHAILGMAFLTVVLMTPASPGWFIWAIPLLVTYQAASGRMAVLLVSCFSVLYLLDTLLLVPLDGSSIVAGLVTWREYLPGAMQGWLTSLAHTMMLAAGIILMTRMWRESVIRNDYFRLSRKPFVIGIAGDSGAGKDTFSDAIRGLFGSHSTTTLSGDDYHLWDRQKPIWQVMTHLNPMANDLDGFADDVVALTDGKSIQGRHYDHATGRMSRPFRIDSNDFIIATGLHALYLPILRQAYDLKIYLDIDERLRRHFKLTRDVQQRGHSVERVLSSFERREPDSERFIRPQAACADLILSLKPIHPRMLEDVEEGREKQRLRFKLTARSRFGLNELALTRALVGVCGLHVDKSVNPDGSDVELTIEGETSAEDIALASNMVCPRISEFMDIAPKWQDGVVGLMQLITVSHINQALTKRFI